MQIAKVNHLSNPLLTNSRNIIMKYSKIPQLAQKKLHSYDAEESIKKAIQ
jgi:hypothetical protein